jgi:hypothetical protein
LFDVLGILFDFKIVKDDKYVVERFSKKRNQMENVLTYTVIVEIAFWAQFPDGTYKRVVKQGVADKMLRGSQDPNYVHAAAVSEAYKRALLQCGLGMELYEEDIEAEPAFYIPEDMKGKSKFYTYKGQPKDKQLNWASDLLAKSNPNTRQRVQEKLQLDVDLNPESSNGNFKDQIKDIISDLNMGQVSMIIDLLKGNRR